MKKPVIGLVPLVDYEKESVWMLPGYIEGIFNAGGIPVMLSLTDDPEDIKRYAEMCDGFLFTGGHDVTPSEYGEETLPVCGECCPERDRMERLLLLEAIKEDKSVLGICRGIQLINVVLGGTLYQDLPAQCPSDVIHHQDRPYDAPSHEISIVPGSPIGELLGRETAAVNSCHHQGIKKLSPELKVMATAPDGIIEAVYMPENRFVWAVQWHPEFSHKVNGDSVKIFEAFVQSGM